MAELILTQEEKDAINYLDIDDVALAKVVRKVALDIQDHYGMDAMYMTIATKILMATCIKTNADQLNSTMYGVTDGSDSKSDWSVVIKKLKSTQAS